MGLFRKKAVQTKIINGTKGVISLLLCLLVTPVLTISASLIEFSRYQNAQSVLNELMDSAALSTLSNFDPYLQNRFGLFAVSQDCDINATYRDNLLKNRSVIEGLYVADGVTAEGFLPLSKTDVIRRQLLDFSEGTVLSEVLLEDLNLQQLLDELEKLMNIGGLIDTLGKMNDMTTKIKELVESGEAFVDTLENIEYLVGELVGDYNTKGKANEFAEAVADLYEAVCTTDFEDDEPVSSSEEPLTFEEKVADQYFSKIKTVYTKGDELVNAAQDLKSAVVSLPDKLSAFKTDYNEAVAAVNAVKQAFSGTASSANTGSAGQGSGSVNQTTADATKPYKVVLDEIGKAIDAATNKLKESTINSLKEAANSLVGDLKSKLGLGVMDRWNLKEYYSVPLSDAAQADLEKLLSKMPSTWNDTSSYNQVIETIKEMFIPDVFNMNVSDIITTITRCVKQAKDRFVSNVKESVGKILTDLVNTINGLFDLDLFYDGRLNAFLSEAEEADNPYASMLEALSSVLTAVKNFQDALAEKNILKKFGKVIDAIVELGNALKAALESIKNLAEQMVDKIGYFVVNIKTGEWENFGYLLLLCGYMTHNLPNRTSVGPYEISIDTNTSVRTNLNGTALTGFKYNDIKTPSKKISNGLSVKEGQSSISALADFMSQTVNGGSDKMFRGAELEYIMAGTSSEIMNQTVVFMQIYFLRLLVNLVPVFTDPAVTAMAAAATIGCLAVYLIVAFAEPLCDTVLLVNGGDVCFIKRSCYLTPTGVTKLASDLSSVVIKNQKVKESAVKSFNNAVEDRFKDTEWANTSVEFNSGIMPMGYDTHCLILMFLLTPEPNIVSRFSRIVQLESQAWYKAQGKSFSISKAYTGITGTAEAEMTSFLSIFQSSNSSSVIKKKFTRTSTY